MPKVAGCSDLSVVESEIVPRINQLCLATTNAGVRVAALSALAALASRLPKDHALRSLSTIAKVAEPCCFPACPGHQLASKAVLAVLDSSHERCLGVGLKCKHSKILVSPCGITDSWRSMSLPRPAS